MSSYSSFPDERWLLFWWRTTSFHPNGGPTFGGTWTTTWQNSKIPSSESPGWRLVSTRGEKASGRFIFIYYLFLPFPSLFHTKHRKRLITRPKARTATWPLPKVLSKIHVTAVLHMYSRKEIALIRVNQNGLIAQKLHFPQNFFTMIST